MILTSRSTARRAGSLVATLGVMLAMFLVASPAQAAVDVELTVNDTTITQGDSVTLSWSIANTEPVEVVASGDWSGTKAQPTGNEIVTPTGVGDHTYTLTATDTNGRETSDSVTVTVSPITPNPVTFPDPCTVVIPTTAHVQYLVDFGGGDVEKLDPGTYDGSDFSFGDEVTFIAEADDGFDLDANAVAKWTYTAPESCSSVDEGPDLVTTEVACGSVTFTNTTDGPLDVAYGSFAEDQQDGEFTLDAGATKKVKTNRPEFAFIASTNLDDEQAPVQVREIEVPQKCGGGHDHGDDDGSDHPTVAPAAGIAAR